MKMRLRAAPSPTGKVHLGNIRTYLYNYLLAKRHSGVNIMRVEDTDMDRKIPNGTQAMIEAYEAVGITFDEGPHVGGEFGPYVQSERKDIYAKHAKELIDNGHAYYCFCSKERLDDLRAKQEKAGEQTVYDRSCRSIDTKEAQQRVDNGDEYVIRMKFPTEGKMGFDDAIYGRIVIDNKEIDDMILIKSDGLPTYHFAVVVDDHLMGVTHVIRGREYLTQTTRNVFLYDSFGWDQPIWCHVAPILNPDGKGKLSKRHGAMSLATYLRLGYLTEGIINYIMLAGWAPDPKVAKDDEIYTLDEFIAMFDLDRIQKAGARFDIKKMDHMNAMHIRRIDTDVFAGRVISWAKDYVLGEFLSDVIEDPNEEIDMLKESVTDLLPKWESDMEYFKASLALVHERVTKLSGLPELLDFFYEDLTEWSDEDWKLNKHEKNEYADALEAILPKLDELFKDEIDPNDHDGWEKVVRGYADELEWGHGDMFLALRSATTGRLQSPPLLESFEVMGWEKTRKHVLNAIEWLRK